MTRAIPFLLLVLLALAACDTFATSASNRLTGSYELVRVGGESVPVEVWRGYGVSGVLESERLEFSADGSVIRSNRFVETDLGTGTENVIDHTWEMEYRRNGRSIEIGRFTPCPPNALCVPNDVGTVRDGRLELESSYWTSGGRTQLVYMLR